MEQNELMHYGVLGMKWGVRKDRKRITIAQANRNARNNEHKAKLEYLQSVKGTGMTARRASKNMVKVGQKARRESLHNDRMTSKQIKADNKMAKRGKGEASSFINRFGKQKVSELKGSKNS